MSTHAVPRRHGLLPAAASGIALVLAACSAASTGSSPVGRPGTAPPARPSAVPVGTSSHVLAVGGLQRTYLLYRPARMSDPAPLVVMLHGGFGSGRQAERDYGWDGMADAHGFLVAYPDGLNHAWNAGGGCCGKPAQQGVDDVGFLTALVAAIKQQAPIDPRRVYVTGMSNGGIMAYTLACRTKDVFAAYGPVAATQLGPCPSPRPASIIHIHGTADQHVRYYGGRGTGVAHIDGPAVPTLNATWRAVDGCGPPRVTTAGAVTTSVATCPGGHAVELISVAGAGHQWPGSVPKPVIQRILHTDPPSTALDATQVIWSFFAAHPLPA